MPVFPAFLPAFPSRTPRASTRRLCLALTLPLLAAGLLAHAPVRAQLLKDPALEALYAGERLDEPQRVATARLAAQPDDAQAVLGLALAALERDDAKARPPLIQQAERCIERQPRAAACHYALGVTLGVQAAADGMFKLARSVGTVKTALTQAHTLDPDWYAARQALVEFYLLVPGMLGGSSTRAAELARGAPRPEQAKALGARVALADKQFEPALQALAGLPLAGMDRSWVADLRTWSVQAGLGLVNAGQSAKAQPHFERLRREHPENSGPAYGLARARGEQGATEEALKLYEQALALKDAAQWPLNYRIGMSLQTLGRKDAAKVAYERFLALGKGPKSLLDDARQRLDQLGA